jgi:hypothetical protein
MPFEVLKVPEKAFWRMKPRLVERMREERDIIVSVTHSTRDKLKLFEIKGAGWTRSEAAFAFRVARQFEDLKKVSSHFQIVQYNEKTQKLFVRTEALGWYADMLMQISLEENAAAKLYNIYWINLAGSFKGMKGVGQLRGVASDQCEISIVASYEAEVLPLPSVLMNMGLEFVLQKVTEKMRRVIESEFKRSTMYPLPPLSPTPQER